MTFSTHDQVPDSPTNVFAVCNVNHADASAIISNGSLSITGSSSFAISTIAVTSGIWYFECHVLSTDGSFISVAEVDLITHAQLFDAGNNDNGYGYYASGQKTRNNTFTNYGSAHTSGDILGCCFDLDNGKIYFSLNGSWVNGNSNSYSNLSSITEAFSGLSGRIAPKIGHYNNDQATTFNAGQDPTFGGATGLPTAPSGSPFTDANGIGSFYYQPPTGALALCTANLPSAPDLPIDSAVDDLPEDYFKAVTYTGDGNVSGKTITTNLAADFVWIKNRDATIAHVLFDSVRGVSNVLQSNSTGAAYTDTNTLTNFGSTSFAVGSNDNAVNQSSIKYVAWCWKAGGAPTADNTATSGAMTANSVSVDGTLQSSYTPSGSPTIYPKRMSVNTKAGFSIIKYTGTGTHTHSFPHGLTNVLDFVIIKSLGTNGWIVKHSSLASSNQIALNSTGGQSPNYGAGGIADLTSPNVVNFYHEAGSTNVNNVNKSETDYICYAWHSVPGYSAFGSYEGSTSADGPFVYTGFKPAWVMIKGIDDNGYNSYQSWTIIDNARSQYNPDTKALYANLSSQEGVEGNGSGTTNETVDILSNGFKIRTGAASINGISGITHIYAAFAEQPFKYANAR